MITPMTKCACCGEPMQVKRGTLALSYCDLPATVHECPRGCWKQTFPDVLPSQILLHDATQIGKKKGG